jgi:AcrR family transcriptional regulator
VLEVPNKDRRAERREATRDEIVGAAWDLVRAHGLAGLSLRDLAAAVGMKAPSLYSYFASKNDIYDAMFAQGVSAYVQQEAEVPTTGVPLTDLRAGVGFFVRFCTEDPVRYQLLFQRTIPGFEPTPETFAIALAGFERLQLRLAGIGITDQRSLDLLTAIGTGLTDQQISNDPGGDRWSRLIDEAMEMFYTHVTKTKPARTRRAG